MPNIKKKKKPAKINTGRYSRAELDRIKAARLKHVKTPAYFMSDEYKKKVLAGRKKKPAGDEVTNFLKRTPLAKTKKTTIAAKEKAVVKKKAAAKKIVSYQYKSGGPVLTPKSLKKAPGVAKKKAVAKKAPVASKKKKKRSFLGRLKMRRLKKMSKRGIPVTKPKGVSREELSPKGRIRKGAKKVLLTKGGAYASYEKGSKAAKSFRSAFKSGCAGGKKSFSWDGRSYSCKKK